MFEQGSDWHWVVDFTKYSHHYMYQTLLLPVTELVNCHRRRGRENRCPFCGLWTLKTRPHQPPRLSHLTLVFFFSPKATFLSLSLAMCKQSPTGHLEVT